MFGPAGPSEMFRNLESKSDEWLIEELREQLLTQKQWESQSHLSDPPIWNMRQTEQNIYALTAELESRGYNV